MKKLILLSVAATLISSLSFATIRRVGFFGPVVSGVDYPGFQAAHDAAAIGDTIMMGPKTHLSGELSKRLVILGPGFFLNPANAGNAGLQIFTEGNVGDPNSVFGQLRFKAGSTNSILEGCTIGRIFDDGLAGIVFKRCWLT